jgi:hypothetical protein
VVETRRLDAECLAASAGADLESSEDGGHANKKMAGDGAMSQPPPYV